MKYCRRSLLGSWERSRVDERSVMLISENTPIEMKIFPPPKRVLVDALFNSVSNCQTETSALHDPFLTRTPNSTLSLSFSLYFCTDTHTHTHTFSLYAARLIEEGLSLALKASASSSKIFCIFVSVH